MGCGDSRGAYDEYPFLAKYRNEYNDLGLGEREIGLLYKTFRRADSDHGGSISRSEFLDLYDISSNNFAKKIFRLFDIDSSGNVDFHEFVFTLWFFCTCDKATLAAFAFDLYDTNGGGTLNSEEIIVMINDLFGSKANNQTKAIIQFLDSTEKGKPDGEYNIDQFFELATQYTCILFAPFQLQMEIRAQCLTSDIWNNLTEERQFNSDGKFMRIPEYLKMMAKKRGAVRGAKDSIIVRDKDSVRRSGPKTSSHSGPKTSSHNAPASKPKVVAAASKVTPDKSRRVAGDTLDEDYLVQWQKDHADEMKEIKRKYKRHYG